MKDIAELIFNRLINDLTLPTLYFENVESDIPTGDHLIINIIPVSEGLNTIGSTVQNKYLLHIVCCTLRGVGQIKAIEIGEKVLNLFPKNLILQPNPLISIDLAGKFGTGYIDGKWYKLPIKININSIKP